MIVRVIVQTCFQAIFIALFVPAVVLTNWSTNKQNQAIADLRKLVRDEGSVRFLSWNGKMIRKDCDTEITFLPEQKVRLKEHGYSVNTFMGKYTINSKGEIRTEFENYGHVWPVMILKKDSKSLLLMPKDDSGFLKGSRGAAFVPKDKGTFWPFRPVMKN
jgi:hypothetical protein